MSSVRVRDFTPRVNGFHFRNEFAADPIRTFRLGNIATLDIGDAANGLCGGMSFTVRDIFEAGLRPPPDPAPPARGNAKFAYIVDRQIDSFANGVVPLRFFKLMDPDDRSASRAGRRSWAASASTGTAGRGSWSTWNGPPSGATSMRGVSPPWAS